MKKIEGILEILPMALLLTGWVLWRLSGLSDGVQERILSRLAAAAGIALGMAFGWRAMGHLPRAERWALALALLIALAGISLGLRPAIRDACFAARAGPWCALVWTWPPKCFP
jgi:hypothetical protein